MDFYLQFAYQMQVVCCDLIQEWGGGTVIMSPRDCKPLGEDKSGELEKHAASIRVVGGRILIDPQFYRPESDHKVLTSHAYWPDKYDSVEFWEKRDEPDYGELLKRLGELNAKVEASAIILPGTLATVVDDEWLARQSRMIGAARMEYGDDEELLATVALSADAVRSADQVHAILAAAGDWRVQGIYLICEHPDGQYLVENDAWIANILDLTAGFRLRGQSVVIGYANQQMLVAACASVTAIASGSHKMKRQFSSSTMMEKDGDDVMRQATWYYCPQAYSEFKIPRLDSANLQKVLGKLRHPEDMGVCHADVLFAGAQPSTVGFRHKLSFKHYLGSLHAQSLALRKATFNDTVQVYRGSLDAAEKLLKELQAKRIRAEERSFLPAVDPTHVGVNMLVEDRGAMLRHVWPNL